MRKNYFTFIVALFIFLIPFLGFPRAWDTFLIGFSAVVLMIMAAVEYIRHRFENTEPRISPPQQAEPLSAQPLSTEPLSEEGRE